MILECFQTVEDLDNADYIERNGPFKCVRTDAWLGEGYYFWDSNIEWAHSWGAFYEENGYIICQAQIRFDETVFDLYGNVQHNLLFERAYLAIRQQTDREITVPQVITAMRKMGRFAYNAIRAFDQPSSVLRVQYNIRKSEQLIINQRVQICLLNKNNLLSQTFRIVFPERYVL